MLFPSSLGGSVRLRRFAVLITPSAPALRLAQLFLRLRPIGLALRALLCEEGNFDQFPIASGASVVNVSPLGLKRKATEVSGFMAQN